MTEAAAMKSAWNRRAEKDAFFYVETASWDGDVEAFFALGEERAQLLIDPVLEQYAPRRGLAVEIGAGVGRFCRALGRRFERVIGFDVAEGMVRRAQQLNASPNVSFVATDGLSLPVTDADFVFSYEVFQHMPSQSVVRQNLKAAARAKAKDGLALIHIKTGYPRPWQGLVRAIPAPVIAPLKAVLGKDRLTTDDTFRGHPPIGHAKLRAMTEEAGMEVLELREDPTHGAGTRIFLVAR